MENMLRFGVDTRPVFYSTHTMPMYLVEERFPIAQDLSSRGISLPRYPILSNEEVEMIVQALKKSAL